MGLPAARPYVASVLRRCRTDPRRSEPRSRDVHRPQRYARLLGSRVCDHAAAESWRCRRNRDPGRGLRTVHRRAAALLVRLSERSWHASRRDLSARSPHVRRGLRKVGRQGWLVLLLCGSRRRRRCGRGARPHGCVERAAGASAYWAASSVGSDASDIVKVPLSGGEPKTLACGVGGVYGLAVDESYVYFSTYYEDGHLGRFPKNGQPPL
jgi:hypothetical protein